MREKSYIVDSPRWISNTRSYRLFTTWICGTRDGLDC
jgi:hypothetical protein